MSQYGYYCVSRINSWEIPYSEHQEEDTKKDTTIYVTMRRAKQPFYSGGIFSQLAPDLHRVYWGKQ